MRNDDRGDGRPEVIALVTVVLRLAVEHVASGPDHGSEQRVRVEDGRAHRACTAAKQRLLASAVPAGREARAGRCCKDKFRESHDVCPFWNFDVFVGRCSIPALLFNIKRRNSELCAVFCCFLPGFGKKKNAGRTMWGSQACPRKEGVRNSRCLCDAGKVESHGSFTMHSTIPGAKQRLFPNEIPAETCPYGKNPRKIAPTPLRPCLPSPKKESDAFPMMISVATRPPRSTTRSRISALLCPIACRVTPK